MSLLEVHRQELGRFRSSMNLVGPGSLDLHFQDCLLGLQGLDLQGSWVDLGSGAGFPGLVIAHCFPHLPVTLVESRQKRATFLRHVVMTAGVHAENVVIQHSRVEMLPSHTYSGATSRGFAPPARFLEAAEELVQMEDGQILLFLQQHEDVVVPPHLSILHENRYEVEGKQRRTLLLSRA